MRVYLVVRRDRHLDVLVWYWQTLPWPSTKPFSRTIRSLSRRWCRRLLGKSSSIHRDPNVRDLHGWSTLIPSHVTNHWPLFLRQRMIPRFFWSGDNLAKTVVVSTTCANSWSVIVSISLPKESALHLVLLFFTDSLGDLSLSPVKILVVTPHTLQDFDRWSCRRFWWIKKQVTS